jgi:hypothetical protein
LTLLIGPTIPAPVPSVLTDALRSMEVRSTDEGRDGFQITFTLGRSGQLNSDFSDYPLINNPLLKPFNRVIIILTFGASPKVLIDGFITHQQLNPSNEPGKSTLTITGEDVSIMMDMEEKSDTHPNQSDVDIVTQIILSYGQYGLVPIVIPPLKLDNPTESQRVPSQQGTDLAYLLQLARLYDYVFYIQPSEVPGVSNAFWGPLDLTGTPQKALTINMGPETNLLSINTQYGALTPNTVTGSIQIPFTNITLPINISASLRPSLSSMPAVTANQPNVRSKQFRDSGLNVIQALVKAQAEVDQSMDAVTISGELDVLRYGDLLRARKRVGLRGAGFTNDGFYYVKNVTHTIKRGEYKQSFTLTREGLGSTIKAVQP